MILKEEYGNTILVMTKALILLRRPIELKHFETVTDINQAIAREKQLKGWSRKKKQALIAENFNRLKELAKSNNQK
jgi:putative endonuclease